MDLIYKWRHNGLRAALKLPSIRGTIRTYDLILGYFLFDCRTYRCVSWKYGIDEFSKEGLSVRILIIDDEIWMAKSYCDEDNPHENRKSLILGREQMTPRLHRFNGEKFRKYKSGSLLGPNPTCYNSIKRKMIILKAHELKHATKSQTRAVQLGVTDH